MKYNLEPDSRFGGILGFLSVIKMFSQPNVLGNTDLDLCYTYIFWNINSKVFPYLVINF